MTLTPLLTLPEVAAYLRCTERTVRRINREVLPYHKTGRKRLYRQASVEAYVVRKSEPKPEAAECGSLRRKARRILKPAGITPTAQDESFRARLNAWQSGKPKHAAGNSKPNSAESGNSPKLVLIRQPAE